MRDRSFSLFFGGLEVDKTVACMVLGCGSIGALEF